MIISKPHFLNADKDLLDKVEGLKPNTKLHDNYFQFELVRIQPVYKYISLIFKIAYSKLNYTKIFDFNLTFQNTGSPVSLRNRLQFAIQVEQIEGFDLMANITSAVVPLVWIEESLDLPKEVTNAMRYGIYMYVQYLYAIKWPSNCQTHKFIVFDPFQARKCYEICQICRIYTWNFRTNLCCIQMALPTFYQRVGSICYLCRILKMNECVISFN